jgi:hypothetical protein
MFAKKVDNKVQALWTNDGKDLQTDPCKVEETLFDNFFAGKHLREKGADFDDFFYRNVNKIYDDIIVSNAELHYETEQEESFATDLNSEITVSDIAYFIKRYQTSGKSFDNYEFHPLMLKHLGTTTLECLATLFNSCLSKSCWVWDLADVIFLKKDGKKDYSNAGSYRPISITSYIGKIFEQIIASRLERYFNSVGLNDKNQEGFTKRRNTVRYLHRLDSDIREKLDKKYTVICLFIDFEKAFDSVWKKGLMKKLADAGVGTNMWKLINSFLFTRKVRLVFNDYYGLVRACREFGLPQGSALSPILFKFYIHDLEASLSHRTDIEVFKFADDGTIRVFGETTLTCLENLKEVCDALHRWSTQWRMIINCDPCKTELICFGTAEKDPNQIQCNWDKTP